MAGEGGGCDCPTALVGASAALVDVSPSGSTTIVPNMIEWIRQKYGYVPGVVKVIEREMPGANVPVSHAPVEVAVCDAVSPLCQVTVSPAATVTVLGWNAKSFTSTVAIAACAAGGSARSATEMSPAAIQPAEGVTNAILGIER